MNIGFTAIIGRPSAGKSTLLNALCGRHIAITSPYPQTTRNKIRGILTEERGQIIGLDTPGYHDSGKKLNLYLRELVQNALEEAEAVLYVIDASRPLGAEEREILTLLANLSEPARKNLPVTAALNKTELPNARPGQITLEIQKLLPKVPIHPVSALTGAGLGPLKADLFAALPKGELLYPAEYYTDQPPALRIAEIIREEALRRVRDEIPHALYIDIADMEEQPAPPPSDKKPNPQPTLAIRAFLTVERKSQIGIIVGRGGAGIKAIRQAAQKEIGRLFPQRIHLDLRVKANPRWRRRDPLLKTLIQ